ncbi:MAG: tyrosine-protein phosphatase [Lactobacillus sp.]|nr:tyrosine-protein phosphatase [Lactobacillus sp.]
MTTKQRLLLLDGPRNFRDLGGYASADGKMVKWQRIYRADALSQLSDQDCQQLSQLRITANGELRSTYEQTMAPDRHWPGMRHYSVPLYSADSSQDKGSNRLFRLFHRIPDLGDNYLGTIYQQTLLNTHSQQMFAAVFEQLLRLPADEALVYHCSAGKDRTGMTSALILMSLGVADDTIARDYLLSNELYDFSRDQLAGDSELTKRVAKMNVTKGEGTAILGITETIRQGWGDFVHFFIRELGFTRSDYDQLCEQYLTSQKA